MKNLIYLSILSFLVSCASIDLPPGGDKDQTPPRIVQSNPDSAETYFTGDQIKITFDEYFSLNNFNNALIVSPPLSSQPKTRIKGKTLYLQCNEPLKPNTTYQFYFDDGIKDLNEGNATKNLRLVFSTGPTIDTAFLKGKVINAFTRLPEENIKVFLYKHYTDSQLVNELPFYITKTNKHGEFTFNNIVDTTYYLYALKDDNNNNALDINERYAFSQTPTPSNTSSNNLYLSQQATPQPLSLLSFTEKSNGQYFFVFNRSLKASDKVQTKSHNIYSDVSKDFNLPFHFGETQDTLYIYNNSKELSLNDSFYADIIIKQDTFTKKLFKNKPTSYQPKLLPKSPFSPSRSLAFEAGYAIRKINQTLVGVYDLIDSTNQKVDSINILQSNLLLYSSWKEGHTYQIIFQPNAVSYYNNTTNSQDTFLVNTLALSKTGELEIKVDIDSSLKQKNPFILHLTKNNEVIETRKVSNGESFQFNYLLPGEYGAYIFYDTDGNENWTDSDFYKKAYSEDIWHLNSPIEIRAKWKTNGILFKIK